MYNEYIQKAQVAYELIGSQRLDKTLSYLLIRRCDFFLRTWIYHGLHRKKRGRENYHDEADLSNLIQRERRCFLPRGEYGCLR